MHFCFFDRIFWCHCAPSSLSHDCPIIIKSPFLHLQVRTTARQLNPSTKQTRDSHKHKIHSHNFNNHNRRMWQFTFQPPLPPQHYAFHNLDWGQTVLCVDEDVTASKNIPTDFCSSIYLSASVMTDWRQKVCLWRSCTSARPHGVTYTKIGNLHRLPHDNLRYVVRFLPGNSWRLNFICRRFGTLCLFHLHRQVAQANFEPNLFPYK